MSEPHDDPFERVQREFQRLFHDLVFRRHPTAHFAEVPWRPELDITADENHAFVRIEVAGVARQDLHVSLQGSVLRVWGRRRAPGNLSGRDYHRAEIFYGPFERTVELPWQADPDHIKARYKDGMLDVELLPLARPRLRRTNVTVESRE